MVSERDKRPRRKISRRKVLGGFAGAAAALLLNDYCNDIEETPIDPAQQELVSIYDYLWDRIEPDVNDHVEKRSFIKTAQRTYIFNSGQGLRILGIQITPSQDENGPFKITTYVIGQGFAVLMAEGDQKILEEIDKRGRKVPIPGDRGKIFDDRDYLELTSDEKKNLTEELKNAYRLRTVTS